MKKKMLAAVLGMTLTLQALTLQTPMNVYASVVEETVQEYVVMAEDAAAYEDVARDYHEEIVVSGKTF